MDSTSIRMRDERSVRAPAFAGKGARGREESQSTCETQGSPSADFPQLGSTHLEDGCTRSPTSS